MFRFEPNRDTIVQLFQIADKRTPFGTFFTRFCQFQLAKEVDGTKNGSLRTVGVRKRYADKLGWTLSTFDYHIKEGRKWARLCGPFDGLLCFFFLGDTLTLGMEYRQYKELLAEASTEEARSAQHQLHQLLDSDDCARKLCQAGRAFQDSLQGKDVEFWWESGREDLISLPRAERLSFLQPRLPVTDNTYDPSKYPDWPRPAGWPGEWQWPANPTLEGAAGCHCCREVACDCINQLSGSCILLSRWKTPEQGRWMSSVCRAFLVTNGRGCFASKSMTGRVCRGLKERVRSAFSTAGNSGISWWNTPCQRRVKTNSGPKKIFSLAREHP
jgi:hypothetical protein